MRVVRVPFERLPGWLDRYAAAHPGTAWTVTDTAATTQGPDASAASIAVPFAPLADLSLEGLLAHVSRRWPLGVVLARKGGFAVARLTGSDVEQDKIGRRWVQGRTKAGGWSQQRFARRRENQARSAYAAASDHVQEILSPHVRRLQALGVGGDRAAVTAVLGGAGLSALAALPQVWLGGVPDPTREVLAGAVERLRSVEISITDPPDAEGRRTLVPGPH